MARVALQCQKSAADPPGAVVAAVAGLEQLVWELVLGVAEVVQVVAFLVIEGGLLAPVALQVRLFHQQCHCMGRPQNTWRHPCRAWQAQQKLPPSVRNLLVEVGAGSQPTTQPLTAIAHLSVVAANRPCLIAPIPETARWTWTWICCYVYLPTSPATGTPPCWIPEEVFV